MGSITRTFANNILTSGNFNASALAGTLPAISGASLTGVPKGLTLLSTSSITSGDATVLLDVSNDSYDTFLVVGTNLTGDSGSNGRPRFRMKREGQGSADSGSSDYGAEGILYDTGGSHVINENYSANSILAFPFDIACTRLKHFTFYVVGARTTSFRCGIHGGISQEGDGTQTGHVGFGGNRNSTDKVTDIQFDYTTGNIDGGEFKVYGVQKT